MTYTTLISVDELIALRASSQDLMIFDCSYELSDPAAGDKQFAEKHIPDAVRADLDRHLSGKNDPHAASGGRHPLPSREKFAEWLSSLGFHNGTQAVVYDRQGVNYCGRLWWMLKWAGHDAVAVLDGGLQAWELADQPIEEGIPNLVVRPTNFVLEAPLRKLVTVQQVQEHLQQPGQTLIDARGAPRYRGEVEPLDPVAGHIPGALNRPFGQNLLPDGRFKPAAQLRAEFETLLAGRDPATVVHQCGSGVSATPNVLAQELAGLGHAGLFAGSWSEWCSDASRPVETSA